MEDIIIRAGNTANVLHKGQTRKYTGEPYVMHCYEVGMTVATVCKDPEVVAAALLHDTLEDTSMTVEELERFFGPRVARLVDQVTDRSKPEDGNRATRKEIDWAWLAKAEPDAQTIKLADLISNTKSIVDHDEEFARVYMAEKAALLEVLIHGDPRLYRMAARIVKEYKDANP